MHDQYDCGQLAADILTTAVESGYPWFLYDSIERDEDLNVIRATGVIDDESGQTFSVTPADITRAARTLLTNPAWRTIARALLCGADVDYDVNDADSLLQIVVLGEVVFA